MYSKGSNELIFGRFICFCYHLSSFFVDILFVFDPISKSFESFDLKKRRVTGDKKLPEDDNDLFSAIIHKYYDNIE